MFCVKTHYGFTLGVRSSLVQTFRHAALDFFRRWNKSPTAESNRALGPILQ